jgi:hypothetical protein
MSQAPCGLRLLWTRAHFAVFYLDPPPELTQNASVFFVEDVPPSSCMATRRFAWI